MCWVNSDRESGQASTFAFRIRDLPALSVALYQRPASVAMQNSWGLLLRTQAIGFFPTCFHLTRRMLIIWSDHCQRKLWTPVRANRKMGALAGWVELRFNNCNQFIETSSVWAIPVFLQHPLAARTG
jgi:hypothetical protein